MNPALALAVSKAKDANMPNDNIQRAIDKGTGAHGEAETFERITYEGYAPGGVAVLVEVLTDNRNRAASDVRYVFSKNGGKLGTSGSVAYLFERKGVILIPRGSMDEDELMELALEAGAEDVEEMESDFRLVTSPEVRERRDHYAAPEQHRPRRRHRETDPQANRRPGGER